MKGQPEGPVARRRERRVGEGVCVARPDATDSPLRTDPFHARPFYQGVVLQALEALRPARERSRSIYRPYARRAARRTPGSGWSSRRVP